jgi:hypothetical protein
LAAPTDATIVVKKAGDRIGLELNNVKLGSANKPAVAVKGIAPFVNNPKLQPGMVLRDFASAQEVQERLTNGPFPVTLQFRNLAAEGDAIGDLGKPMVTAQDALNLSASRRNAPSAVATNPSSSQDNNSYRTTIIKSSDCNLRSRRLDVLEIVYTAHIGNGPDGPVYDSSLQRGTGRPYQMVLGSGDMLPGVDQGLYDMCPGDKRALDIPPLVAYGARGNKIFGIPPGARLHWEVELVSVNSITKGDFRTRDDMEQRVSY